jgi:hypothetical protein
VTLIPTNTPRVTTTLIPTNTLRPSVTPSLTNTPLPTATYTSSPTLTPSHAYANPEFTPSTRRRRLDSGYLAVPFETPVVEIPPRVPLMEDSDDIVNILMLGSDTSAGGIGRTDVIIVVSINTQAGSVAMWHLPRDLFVYIPNHTMDRLNLALPGRFEQLSGRRRVDEGSVVVYPNRDHYARSISTISCRSSISWAG